MRCDVGALEVVDELVVVPRRAGRARPGGPSSRPRAAAASSSSCWAANAGLPPAPGGGLLGEVGGVARPSRPPCRPSARPTPRWRRVEVEHRSRDPRRGTPGRGWRPRRRPAGAERPPRRTRSPRRRGGWSARRGAGSRAGGSAAPRAPSRAALAAGERADRPVPARCGRARAGRRPPRRDGRVPGVVLDGPVEQRGVLVGARRVVEPRGQLARAGRPPRAGARAPRRGRSPTVVAGGTSRSWPRWPRSVGALHRAGVGRLEAGEETEQGRLAGRRSRRRARATRPGWATRSTPSRTTRSAYALARSRATRAVRRAERGRGHGAPSGAGSAPAGRPRRVPRAGAGRVSSTWCAESGRRRTGWATSFRLVR